MKRRFMQGIQKGGDFQGISTPKSTAIYNYKTAIRYKDREAADKYLQEYADLGGTREGFDRSLQSLHPLYGLNKQEQQEFRISLGEDDRVRLDRAIEFYNQNFAKAMVKEDRSALPIRKAK